MLLLCRDLPNWNRGLRHIILQVYMEYKGLPLVNDSGFYTTAVPWPSSVQYLGLQKRP